MGRFFAMRTIISLKTVAILLLVSFLTASVSAQLSIPIKLYAGGGLSLQDKPPAFNDWYKSGRHLTAGVCYSFMPMVELVGNFEYHTFSSNFGNIGGELVGGGDIKAAMFGVQARMKPSVPLFPIKPYALAGVGMAKVTQSDFDWPPETKIGWDVAFELEDQTKFYYSFGGGILYSFIPKVSFFAEARYTTIQIDGGVSEFDGPIRFWAITAGVRLL